MDDDDAIQLVMFIVASIILYCKLNPNVHLFKSGILVPPASWVFVVSVYALFIVRGLAFLYRALKKSEDNSDNPTEK